MSNLEQLYNEINPETGQIIRKGTKRQDPEPIGWENEYTPSKDLAKDGGRIKEARGGDLGSEASGNTPSKPYSNQF